MQTVIGYARVSTDEQAKEGWSLEDQREKIELYCKLHDFNLTQIISDEGISAKDVKGRPGMLQLLDITTNGKKSDIQAVVCVKIDRLFRNAAEALKYSKIWRKRGIQFHSIHEGVQTDGAAGKMFFALLAVFAEFERDQTSERTKAGLAKRKASGLKLGGEAPYGFSADENGMLFRNQAEQKIIARMKRLRAKGLSCQKVADQLNEKGFRNRSGRKWNNVTVGYLLKRGAEI